MKYRRLTNEELIPLEKKFIQFLVANTITADDWTKMKERRPQQALGLIDIFSDLIFEESMKKVEYLMYIQPKQIIVYRCGPDIIDMLGLVFDSDSDIDFTKNSNWFDELKNNHKDIDIVRKQKHYADAREIEVFKLIESGCRITDDVFYKTFNHHTDLFGTRVA
ncbi:MAG: hypothetical protein JNL70_24275 [Saprospiraceae bacterium]|nr:hypothetical protein [Saprospiraceae bacterium]